MEFASYASYISESDAVDVNEFPHSELYKRYWLDTSNCVMEYQRKNKSVKRMVNKSNIIDTFARYCTLSTSELRKLIKEELTENLAWYEETFSICLRMKGLSLKVWKKNQELRSVSGDELTVFVLSVIFRKHTMIYTKTKPWTTYRVQQPMSVEELHAQCSIHLMYMGGGIFGLIHPLPYTIPSYHQINLVITHQLIHVTRTIGHSRIKPRAIRSKCQSFKRNTNPTTNCRTSGNLRSQVGTYRPRKCCTKGCLSIPRSGYNWK